MWKKFMVDFNQLKKGLTLSTDKKTTFQQSDIFAFFWTNTENLVLLQMTPKSFWECHKVSYTLQKILSPWKQKFFSKNELCSMTRKLKKRKIKSVQKMPKKGKNHDFLKLEFRFFGRFGRIVAENFSEGPTYSQVYPKNFLEQKKKI